MNEFIIANEIVSEIRVDGRHSLEVLDHCLALVTIGRSLTCVNAIVIIWVTTTVELHTEVCDGQGTVKVVWSDSDVHVPVTDDTVLCHHRCVLEAIARRG